MNLRTIKIIVFTPFLLPQLLLRFCTKWKSIYSQDQEGTLKNRANPFDNSILQFLYFFVSLKEYRTVFYHRLGIYKYLFNWYFPGERTCYISTDTKKIGGGFL